MAPAPGPEVQEQQPEETVEVSTVAEADEARESPVVPQTSTLNIVDAD